MINKNYINYSDLPENIEFKDEFKDIFHKMEYSKENMFITPSLQIGRQMEDYSDIQKKNIKRY